MWEGLNQRKFPRVKAGCHIFLDKPDDSCALISKTENVGCGGFCTVLNRQLAKYSVIKIQLDLGDGAEPIACGGRVAWVVKRRYFESTAEIYDTGVEFTELSEEDKNRLSKLIAQYEK